MRWSVVPLLVLVSACGGDDAASPTGSATTAPDVSTTPSAPTTDTDTDTGSSASTADTATAPTGGDPDVATYVPSDWAPTDVTRIVFLGDSITAGAGVFSPSADYASLLVDNVDATWPDHAGNDLTTRFGTLEVIDVSRGQATTEDVLNVQLPSLEAQLTGDPGGATLVVGTIGGNDLIDLIFNIGQAEQEAARIADNVAAIAAWFDDPVRFPGPTYVYLTNIYEPTDGTGQADECFYSIDVGFLEPVLEDINGRTLASARTDGWSWVDLHGHFLGHGHNHDDPGVATYHAEDPTLWLANDCIHPNGRGHHEVRRLFLAAIDNQPLEHAVP